MWGRDFSVHEEGDGYKIVSNNKIALTVKPNATSTMIKLEVFNDLVPNEPRKIEFRISDESVGVTPSENRNHTLTILDDD